MTTSSRECRKPAGRRLRGRAGTRAAGVVALAVALGLLAPAAPAQVVDPRLPRETQSEQLQIRAEQLQIQGKPKEAAALLRQAAAFTPDDEGLLDRTGWACLDANEPGEALKAFESYRKLAVPGAHALGGLLIAHYALGNEKEVRELLRQTAPPDSLPRAQEIVAKGIGATPESAEWSFALGYLYAHVLGSPRGIEPLEAVVAKDPKNAEAWLFLAELNGRIGDGAREDAAAVEYLKLAPETADAFLLRARRYAAEQAYADAAAEYQAGIARHPTAAELYYGLARVYERTGDPKQAEATYRKLVDLASDRKLEALRIQARAQLAGFFFRQGNSAAAEPLYREAAARPDATAATWTSWSASLALLGRWDQAAKALEGAAERDERARGASHRVVRDELLLSRYRAAVYHLAAGRKDLAQAALRTALGTASRTRTTPEVEATALSRWLEGGSAAGGALAYQRGDERWALFPWRQQPDEGELEVRGSSSPASIAWKAGLEAARKRFPDCWPAAYALARVCASRGLTLEAVRLLESIATPTQPWWAPHFTLGDFFTRTREKERGIAALRRAIERAPECGRARTMLSLLSSFVEADEPAPQQEPEDE